MRNPKTQRGMTFISTMILLIVAGFFVMLLMKLGPIYLENYTIKNVVKDLVNDPMLAGRPMREIRDKLDRRLYINEVRRLERDDIQFKREGDKYQLTAIGATRTNTGTGLQTFAFEPVEGADTVGDGYFFGWHTGDTAGNRNSGVVEFGDSPDALMTILTADGQMDGQKLKIGAAYRKQSSFPRQYSIMAVSKKP